ncbi:MAG: pyruvate dehydrogenase (acetyl-transferring) E1 component subunit alpha, partial [Deltaproteobacteria bacterium]
GFPGVVVDGNDLLAVYRATQEAIGRARKGEGPTLIECKTYRWMGHNFNDPELYRKAEEKEAWKQKCPVKRFEEYLKGRGLLDEAKVKEVYRSVNEEIEEAVCFAEASPLPSPEDTLLDVYTD